MKKSAILFSILSVGFFSLTAFAEEQMDPNMDMRQQEGQQGGGMMGGKGGMGVGKGMMHQQPTMIATSDGGVVILQGPKLVKYDSMLTLVNEVELKGGPGGKEKKWKEVPQNDSGPQPMSDAEVAAMLEQDQPAAAEAPAEAPVPQDPPLGQ